MKSVIFGRWGNVLKERGAPEGQPTATGTEGFPSPQGFPENVVAVMSGKGFLQFDEDFDFIPMIYEYVRQIQARYCCGKCITGIKGSKVILLTLEKIMQGRGAEPDLALLARMGEILTVAAKCSVCQSAGELIRDGLHHYRDQFVRALEGGPWAKKVQYMGRISAPCMNTCPCHINIPGYIEALLELRYDESLAIIREEMPLPGITGRVCPAPCENACSVANLGDMAIPIKELKRVAADYELIHHLEPPLKKVELTEAPISVVGGGPAGLSAAYYLTQLGHPVTLFESLSASGGMVAVGIPPYRQPREVLEREIEIIASLGATMEYGQMLGKDFTIDDLFARGFRAVFLGIGSHRSLPIGLEGEMSGCQGAYCGGIDFLREINLGSTVDIGDKVVIVGGGNTAIDCARTCLRMGASQVSIIYRRSESEMPADPVEVEDAREEGVNIHYLTQPIEILSRDNVMIGLKCVRMELRERDSSGRPRPVPVEGSEFILDADTLIPAIGQASNLEFLKPTDGIEITRRGTIKVDSSTMMTTRPGVFAAGDAVSGPLTVVHALAGGKRAAYTIHDYITKGTCELCEQLWMDDLIQNIEKDYGVLVTARRPAREGGQKPHRKLDVEERITSFLEVDSGFTQKSSVIEASRCLRCFHLILVALDGSQ